MTFSRFIGVVVVGFIFCVQPVNVMAADCEFPDHRSGDLEQRALVAVQMRTDASKVFLSWRMLEQDGADAVYDVFRFKDGDEKPVKRNRYPMSRATNFTDNVDCDESNACDKYQWFVKTSKQKTVLSCSYPAALPLDDDKTVISIGNGAGGFGRQFATGELDGKPGADYVLRFSDNGIDPYFKLWRPSRSNFKLLGFSSAGERLWIYDMGPSIENGIWYSPYLVYDLNKDGVSEVIVKGGDSEDTREKLSDETGRIVRGNEYLRLIDGRDGQTVLAEAPWPDREGFVEDPRQPFSQYNHYSRHLMAIAYLDGVNPHVVVVRGTYGKHKVHAYRYTKGSGLIPVWKWENIRPSLVKSCAPEDVLEDLKGLWGQGAHTIRVGDIDNDGKDEVVIGGIALDHNGKPLWSLNLGHLDHIHLGELNPQHDGLEIYYGAEKGQSARGMGMVDAQTGEFLWAHNEATNHIHKEGVCADFYPGKSGIECFSGEANRSAHWLWSSDGNIISQDSIGGATLSPNAAYWGRGTHKTLVRLTRKNDSPHFADMVDLSSGEVIDELHHPSTTASNDWQYSRILAVADIVGDWREEVVVVDRGRLLIYTSTMQTAIKHPWLMTDHLYRMGAALYSMGYEQQPLLSYDLPAAVKMQNQTQAR